MSWTGAWSSEAADGQSYGQLQKGDNQAQSIGSPERKDMPAGLPAGAGIGMNLCVDGGQPQSKEAKEMWWRIAEQYIGERSLYILLFLLICYMIIEDAWVSSPMVHQTSPKQSIAAKSPYQRLKTQLELQQRQQQEEEQLR